MSWTEVGLRWQRRKGKKLSWSSSDVRARTEVAIDLVL